MDWKTKNLSEVAYTAGRIGWKGLTAKEYTESGPYFLSVHSLNYGDFVDFRDAFHISDKRYKESPEIMIKPNDILICKDGAGIGKVGIIKEIPGPTTINSSLLLIRALKSIEPKFLYYKLCSPSFQRIVQERIEGATTPHLYQREIKLFSISFPPISEQKRIVSILDTALADLEQTRVKTEQNLKNARELFDSYLQQIFSQKGEGWIETTLGAEIDLLTGFAFKSKEYVTHSDSTPLIRGDNIVQGKLRWDDVKRWSNDTVSDYEKYQLEVDDIVIAMDRTWVKAGMKFSKITSEDLPALLVQRVARLRVLDSLNSDYLYHLVGSKLFESYVLSIQTGLGVPHISGKQIQSFSFNKPNIEQQKILVSTMNNLRNEVTKLKAIYQKKLNAIDELKKSILQKAFSGELTNTIE
ncbi:restriction endonuclease subunit S [Marinomonas sp. BSi20584]|uniref:restriction endonuclease subunit S n=1 Tax=Marinomonas sp. BSi20584 TaxID=1594462 RepID=UPI000C1DE420|nr:restriction endonuclease subunit S [Marinomonas sp. BSi20584]